MSVTEFRRRNKKFYLFLGMVIVLVPALTAGLICGWQLYRCSRQNKKLQLELDHKQQKSGYVLKQDVKAGQKIELEMLQEINMRGDAQTCIEAVDKKMLVGKYAKCKFKKGTALNAECVYEVSKYSDDMRVQDFNFIETGSMVQTGDFVDVRITYPSGEDYIVVDHKEVLDIHTKENELNSIDTETVLCMRVSEEEILRLASAYVDTVCYADTRIYAITYLDQFQQAGTVNYPVNPHVYQLLGWNPNVLCYEASEQEKQKRNILEEHLLMYTKQDTWNQAFNEKITNDFTEDAADFFE